MGVENQRLAFEGLIPEVVRDAIAGINKEIDAALVASSDALELRDGRPVGLSGPDRLWSFEVDGDVAPPPESPGTLVVPGFDPLDCRVLAVGDTSLVLSGRQDLGEKIAAARLSLDAGFVYARLRERLDDSMLADDVNAALVSEFLDDDPGGEKESDGGPGEAGSTTADEDQERAARRAIEPGVRFTWGPPGTGKTKVLAMAVAAAVARGDRVLVLAHANAAVDVAITRIAELLRGEAVVAQGRVLRVGTPHLPAALACHDVLPDRVVARHQPELAARREELAAERRRISDQLRAADDAADPHSLARRLEGLRGEQTAADRELKAATAELIDHACVVAATLSRAVIDDQLWNWSRDVVIVDEASMVGRPFLLALAMQDAATLSCFGDFRQLPPIAVSDDEAAQRWFAQDVFDASGVREAFELGRADRRLSILRTQFRMGEQICETVSEFAYSGMLRTHRVARDTAIRLADRKPAEGAELVLLDTSSLGALCLTDRAPESFSRWNPLSALVAAALADTLAADGLDSVGVISPYRAQTRLLAAATHDDASITAATIHRFQGSECDAVVLDLTDGPGQKGPSRLTGGDRELALRLLNVAASRARGKLVVVVDRAFVDQFHPLNSMVRQLIERAVDAGAAELDAGELVERWGSDGQSRSVGWFPDWAAATSALLDSALGAARADLNLPHLAHGGGWVGEVIDRISAVTLRCPVGVAREFEATAADIRLQTMGSLPWAVTDATLWVGSASDGPAARITSARVVREFCRLIAPNG